MKKIHKICLLTSSFPYGGGEQFINTEIKYWDGQITILPLQRLGDIDRDVAGSKVDDRLLNGFKVEKKKRIYRMFEIFFRKDIYHELIRKPDVLISVRKMKKMMGFLAIVYSIKASLLKVIEENNPDIIYVYWFSHTAMALSLLKGEYPNIKFVARGHGSDVYEYAWPDSYMPFGAEYYPAFEKIFCVSEHGMNYLHDHFGVPFEYLEVSRLGIDGGCKGNKKKRLADLHVVSVSRMIPLKRLDLLVEALNRYALKNPGVDLKWTHIGAGELLEGIRSKSRGFDLNVDFMGEVENKDVYRFYREVEIDVFINVSTSEGVPVAIMEAISFDVPVIATDVGGVPEIVVGDTGLLLNKDFQLDDLVTAIESIRKKDLKPSVVFEELYSAKKNYSGFVGIINEMANK